MKFFLIYWSFLPEWINIIINWFWYISLVGMGTMGLTFIYYWFRK